MGNRGQFAPHFFHENKNNNLSIAELAFDEEDVILSLEHQLERWLDVISPGIKNTYSYNTRYYLVDLFI